MQTWPQCVTTGAMGLIIRRTVLSLPRTGARQHARMAFQARCLIIKRKTENFLSLSLTSSRSFASGLALTAVSVRLPLSPPSSPRPSPPCGPPSSPRSSHLLQGSQLRERPHLLQLSWTRSAMHGMIASRLRSPSCSLSDTPSTRILARIRATESSSSNSNQPTQLCLRRTHWLQSLSRPVGPCAATAFAETRNVAAHTLRGFLIA